MSGEFDPDTSLSMPVSDDAPVLIAFLVCGLSGALIGAGLVALAWVLLG